MSTSVDHGDYARNAPLFIAFRVFFNARFYYPVLGVLFLDLGLTLEQYAMLNVIWAIVIITLEIPSGALADWIGRKRMVVLAAALMVLEMLVFAFAPTGNAKLLFWMLALNRILSGAAEACASGADEALAYDSLPASERETAWPHLLERLMLWKSAAFFAAMIFGAALFDADFVRAVCDRFSISIEPGTTTRWPVFATCITAFACLAVALCFREPPVDKGANFHGADESNRVGAARSIAMAWINILVGTRHVFTVRRIGLLLLGALLCDSFLRIFLTFASNFYRLIELPECVNGFLGSALALLGFFIAPILRRMVTNHRPAFNFLVVAGAIFIGLSGLFSAVPIWGAWVILPFGFAMSGLQFFTAHYINLWMESAVRATVLSFRGVALNLGYAVAGTLFAALTAHYRGTMPAADESEIFAHALHWLAPSFLTLALAGLLLRQATGLRKN
jgi:MFS family permease